MQRAADAGCVYRDRYATGVSMLYMTALRAVGDSGAQFKKIKYTGLSAE